MKAYRSTKKSGFTLVEILIVVIILGILAAIVIPQFTNASQDARKSSTSSLLQTLRSQVELYKLQHGDTLPALINATPATGWATLTSTSTYNSTTFGPYLQQMPKNPLNALSTVIQGTTGGTPSAAAGFIYDYSGTGKIWAGGSTGATAYNESTGLDVAAIP